MRINGYSIIFVLFMYLFTGSTLYAQNNSSPEQLPRPVTEAFELKLSLIHI